MVSLDVSTLVTRTIRPVKVSDERTGAVSGWGLFSALSAFMFMDQINHGSLFYEGDKHLIVMETLGVKDNI